MAKAIAGRTSGQSSIDEAADKRAALKLCPVSRETEERLERYIALLRAWQPKTNLVAPSTLGSLWERHVADSLQLLDLVSSGKTWIDLGSGGGFPGIVLACALADGGGHVHLVERNTKKAAFLREALRISGGHGTVHLADIEDFVDSDPPAADYVTARALAPLNVLFGLAAPLIQRGAKALFPKGQDVEAELTEATKYWTVSSKLHLSRTNPGGRIVEVDQVSARGASLAERGGKRS
ncbi:16S rRNA (guanine(527)-N(7))-methyltransferase RsmG [Bradyrhizobium sp. LHD-71]|uniref:16S rRNA (guanine(527)-N(7))-methyltransferase RsmG n=1 Tax=Bradyrhizobium sp. LHD-71 TaxID=3072141 RepID=UPI00280D1D65|nr:16S rRNA (guanine(527)-N(7))-methyltransferase RsmG [Bradyrhizobium sp. LHD-71]MDQ8732635.1 16S rRNA (guanine(527)-N(7))-methyltransferase RsmG [Bradyrhizobium sp. LHD-71]